MTGIFCDTPSFPTYGRFWSGNYRAVTTATRAGECLLLALRVISLRRNSLVAIGLTTDKFGFWVV